MTLLDLLSMMSSGPGRRPTGTRRIVSGVLRHDIRLQPQAFWPRPSPACDHTLSGPFHPNSILISSVDIFITKTNYFDEHHSIIPMFSVNVVSRSRSTFAADARITIHI